MVVVVKNYEEMLFDVYLVGGIVEYKCHHESNNASSTNSQPVADHHFGLIETAVFSGSSGG